MSQKPKVNMKTKSFLIAILSLMSGVSVAQKAHNVAALEYGTTIVKAARSRVDITDREVLEKHSTGALFDQGKYLWSSEDTYFPFTFIIELAEVCNIQKLVFDNKCEFYPGIETKNTRVEFSTESADAGFTTVGEYELKKGIPNEISITPQKARWIKVVILSNYGNEQYVQLAEFQAIGVPGSRIGKTIDIHGVWHTNWQDMTFEQNKSNFSGKYIYMAGSRKFKGKVHDGVIDRNSIKFKWDEKTVRGTATLYMNKEGNQLSGMWHNLDNPSDFNLWTMTRSVEETKEIEYSEEIAPEVVAEEGQPKIETPAEQPEPEPQEDEEVAIATPEPPVTPATPTPPATPAKPAAKISDTEVKKGKTIVLKNIIFRQGTAKVDPKSYDELNSLYDYLKENQSARVKINGHTDKIGDPKKNVLLSKARAESVKDYLVKKGIDKDRIATEGLGDTKTICEPPCVQNRRVDFVLVED